MYSEQVLGEGLSVLRGFSSGILRRVYPRKTTKPLNALSSFNPWSPCLHSIISLTSSLILHIQFSLVLFYSYIYIYIYTYKSAVFVLPSYELAGLLSQGQDVKIKFI